MGLILDLKQNTPEWLEYRRNHLGASDAPVIMQVSPWKTPFQLWQEKLGLVKDQPANESMKRGTDLEFIARSEFEKKTLIYVQPVCMMHSQIDYMIASLDGYNENMNCVVEIKCPGREDHSKALDGVVPEKYIPQLQHQLAVTGLDMIYYFSYNGQHNALLRVERDQTYINTLLEKEAAFWEKIQEIESPELTDRDYLIRTDDTWLTTAMFWKESAKQLKRYKEAEEEMRKKLLILSGDKSCSGGGIRVTKSIRKGNVDYKEIPELQGLSLDKYRKPPSDVWRITESK